MKLFREIGTSIAFVGMLYFVSKFRLFHFRHNEL